MNKQNLKIDGIEHFYKLMNYGINKRIFIQTSKEEFEFCMSKINYRRDWWSDIVRYIEIFTNIDMGIFDHRNLKYYVLNDPKRIN